MMDMKKVDIGFILLLVVLCFLLVSRLFFDGFIFGYRTAFVLSPSMEPNIPVASLLIEKKYCEEKQVDKQSELKVGDIITFKIRDDGKVMRVTHRIMKIQGNKINTKGDNNPAMDPWFVMKDQVESRVIFVFSLDNFR